MATTIEQLLNNLVFPEHEGLNFEFKQSFATERVNKIYETICAFLNTEGGYIIFGIEDTNRRIIGLKQSNKQFDEFKQKIDQIYGGSLIHTKSNNRLLPCTILCKMYTNSYGKDLMYIAVKKYSEQCVIKNGATVYRANASNYIVKHEKMYTEAEHKIYIKHITDAHKETTKTMCEQLNNEIKKSKKLEQKNAELEKLLITKILEDKAIAEKALEHEKLGIFDTIYNWFY